MITELPESFKEVISSNNSLQQYLLNLQRGKAPTPRSWLYEDLDPSEVLNTWKTVLEGLAKGDTFEKNVFQFDISQEEKWGPQGGVKPIEDLMADVVLPTYEHADSPRHPAFKSVDWDLAKRFVSTDYQYAKLATLRPASYTRVIDDMRARDTLESNSGWPDFARRNRPEVKASALAAAEDGNWSDYPAIALFRNYRAKTRLVWMFPMAANVYEGSYYQVLQSKLINANLQFYAPWIGFEQVRAIISKIYERSDSYIAASDFSQTDAHFTPDLVMETFDVLVKCFQKPFRTGLRRSLERMYSIPLVISTTEMLTGKHGVSSGSNWTNFIETVFDDIFSRYVESNIGYANGLYAIGDDMAWIIEGKQVKDKFPSALEELAGKVGQVTNAEKVTNDWDKVKTLQRLFQRGYKRPDGLVRGVYSTIRALNSLIFPERYHKPQDWSSDMFCARTYMILENCVDHPYFEKFVEYVVRGQKDLIPFARKSAPELQRITRKSKLLPGLNPTYNAEKRDSSLASFRSIEIAKAL